MRLQELPYRVRPEPASLQGRWFEQQPGQGGEDDEDRVQHADRRPQEIEDVAVADGGAAGRGHQQRQQPGGAGHHHEGAHDFEGDFVTDQGFPAAEEVTRDQPDQGEERQRRRRLVGRVTIHLLHA